MCYPPATYHGDHGEVSAIHTPHDGHTDLTIGQSTVRYLATGESTNQQFGLYRWECEPNTPGPAAHFHRTMSESFFILDGTLRIFNGDQWTNANEGDFLHVPEGGIHAFENKSDDPLAMLILFAPGAPREAFFEAAAELASGKEFTKEEWREICLSHDNIYIDMPTDKAPTAPWKTDD